VCVCVCVWERGGASRPTCTTHLPHTHGLDGVQVVVSLLLLLNLRWSVAHEGGGGVGGGPLCGCYKGRCTAHASVCVCHCHMLWCVCACVLLPVALLFSCGGSVFAKDGVEVLVDEVSLPFIKGATVDFAEDMMRAAFLITSNPNSEGGCGCGVSFRPKEDGAGAGAGAGAGVVAGAGAAVPGAPA
jgi:hypothetical protein